MPVDGAVVHEVFRRESRTELGVLATWSGGSWSPEADESVRQYREGLFLGIWDINAVEVIASREATITWLRPARDTQRLEAGDVLLLGEGSCTVLDVSDTDLDGSGWMPVEFAEQRHHAVLELAAGQQHLFVFHEPSAAISRDANQPLWYRGQVYTVSLSRLSVAGEPLLWLEADGNTVTVNWIIRALQPIRGFVLDAGQEMLFRKQRAQGGRRLGDTYTYFEPRVMPQRGSLRLLIFSAEPVQIPLFVSPGEPLLRLGSVLAAAADHDIEEIANQLSQDLFSTDSLLKKVRELAKAAVAAGGLTVKTPQNPAGFHLNKQALDSVSASIASLKTRTLQRTGTLYGLDTRRNWCRIVVETEEDEIEDWTLRFGDDMREYVEGRVPRDVDVEFETQTRAGVRRGTGLLLSVAE